MDAGDLLHWYCEHAEWVGDAEVFLGRVWELREVGEFLEVVRVYALVVELLGVQRNVFVRVLEDLGGALGLEFADLVHAHFLFGIELALIG